MLDSTALAVPGKCEQQNERDVAEMDFYRTAPAVLDKYGYDISGDPMSKARDYEANRRCSAPF
jgi:hypothetical protein